MLTATLLSLVFLVPKVALSPRLLCERPAQLPRHPLRMQAAAASEMLTITLVDCESGVGIGLDPTNCVDMLRDGSPAANSDLCMGDRVLQWNGIAMIDADSGAQRKLKDVVTPSDMHTLIIERPRTAKPKPEPKKEAMAEAVWAPQTEWKDSAWEAEATWEGDSTGW